MSETFPLTVTSAGPQPQSPSAIRAQLLALVAATNPGYTANLPGSLIEDIASTDVAAIALSDSARVELVNSLTPFAANDFLLNQLGQVYGVPLGLGSTTSVSVVFSGPPGFVIAQGFTVSDGSFQYVAQNGGIIGDGGESDPLFCLAIVQGSWVVPAGTVTQLVTSVPSTISLTVTNPLAGTPGVGPQTAESYRAQVLQAGLAISQGMSTMLRTQLEKVPGVQSRLVSVRQISGGGWEIIVGGGDPYQVAYAIFYGLFDISTLTGSVMAISGITKANPGVVTTVLNHGLTNGQNNVHISGALGMTAANGGPYTVTVITEKTFSFAVDTTGFGTYTGSGVVTPNARNQVVTIDDYPDTYNIPYVMPPQQSVVIVLTWNTTETNFVSATAVAQLGTPALVAYINALPVGVPINLFGLQQVFQSAVASVIAPQFLTRMVFAVSINGVSTPPISGTGIIAGDPESYFETDPSGTQITITQG